MALFFDVMTGPDQRLRVSRRDTLVRVAPELRSSGQWIDLKSSLVVSPEVARALAPALVEMAATIDGAPPEPQPTDESRAESRYP